MASFTIRLSFCLLLLTISCSQIQARESKFFSKTTHYVTVKPGNGVEGSKPPQIEIPVAPPEYISLAPTPAPAYAENKYGSDLYVPSEEEMLTPTKEAPATTTNKENYENEVLNEEFNGQSLQTRYPNSNYNNGVYSNNYNYKENTNTKENSVHTNLYTGNGYSRNYNENGETKIDNTNGYTNNYEKNMYTATYSTNDNKEVSNNYNNNKGYTTNYNTNGYQTGQRGMSDTKFLENGRYYYDVNNNGYTSNHNTNSYETEQRGMSDTRFLENGKYYYNVNNERTNINAYVPEKTTTMNKHNSNPYEFNTMEEYYQSQGYHETPEVNVP